MINKIKINNLEEIETDQLIWDIEHSKNFYIYELEDNNSTTNILVKIIYQNNSLN